MQCMMTARGPPAVFQEKLVGIDTIALSSVHSSKHGVKLDTCHRFEAPNSLWAHLANQHFNELHGLEHPQLTSSPPFQQSHLEPTLSASKSIWFIHLSLRSHLAPILPTSKSMHFNILKLQKPLEAYLANQQNNACQ